MSPSDLFAPAELIGKLIDHIMAVLQTPAGLIGYLAGAIAAALIVVSSFVKTMIPLRWLAVGSNLGFALYGALQSSLVTLALSVVLLPINVWRAIQMKRLTQRVSAAASSDDSLGVWLKPYMKTKRLKADAILFRRGDTADHLYFLAEGRIEFVEIGQMMEPGRIFGEIAFFAPDRQRTQTARCADECTVLSIDESTVRQLYYQNPKFGFELVGLIAGRLSADVRRLQAALEASANAEAPVNRDGVANALAPADQEGTLDRATPAGAGQPDESDESDESEVSEVSTNVEQPAAPGSAAGADPAAGPQRAGPSVRKTG